MRKYSLKSQFLRDSKTDDGVIFGYVREDSEFSIFWNFQFDPIIFFSEQTIKIRTEFLIVVFLLVLEFIEPRATGMRSNSNGNRRPISFLNEILIIVLYHGNYSHGESIRIIQ